MTAQNPYVRHTPGQAIAASRIDLNAPSVSMRSFIQPVDGIALASFDVVYQGQKNPTSTASAIEGLFGNEIAVIPGTMRENRRSNSGIHSVVTARLIGKRKTVFVGDAKAPAIPNNFTCVSKAKNLFMDDNDQMWDLVKQGGRTTLVRKESAESNDALEQLLGRFAPVTASSIKSANELVDEVHDLANQLEVGTLVSYVQPNTRQVKAGFVIACASDKAELVPDLGAVESVPLSLLLKGYSADQYSGHLRQPKYEAIANDAINSREAMISYYRQIFGMNEGFWGEFLKQLRQMCL
jgi:hypothetical protein